MKQHIQRLLRQKWALPTVTGIVGTGVGVLIGYRFTKAQYDRIEKKLEEVEAINDQLEFDFTTAEIQAAKEEADLRWEGIKRHPSYSHEDEIPMIPEEVVDRRLTVKEAELLERAKEATRVPSPEQIGEAVVTNIFSKNNDDAGDEWDYKSEIEARDKATPYVIHVDEFVNDEMGWDSQSTLTWYEKDQILCDDHDRPIYNHNEVVGELRFGHGSNDVNVVYIRNEKLQAEYEVIRDVGSYEEIVLGEQMERETQQEELKHSHQMRFRQE